MAYIALLADAAAGPVQGAVALGALVPIGAASPWGAWMRRALFRA